MLPQLQHELRDEFGEALTVEGTSLRRIRGEGRGRQIGCGRRQGGPGLEKKIQGQGEAGAQPQPQPQPSAPNPKPSCTTLKLSAPSWVAQGTWRSRVQVLTHGLSSSPKPQPLTRNAHRTPSLWPPAFNAPTPHLPVPLPLALSPQTHPHPLPPCTPSSNKQTLVLGYPGSTVTVSARYTTCALRPHPLPLHPSPSAPPAPLPLRPPAPLPLRPPCTPPPPPPCTPPPAPWTHHRSSGDPGRGGMGGEGGMGGDGRGMGAGPGWVGALPCLVPSPSPSTPPAPNPPHPRLPPWTRPPQQRRRTHDGPSLFCGGFLRPIR